MQGRLNENVKFIEVEVPKAHNSTACTAEWICLKNCERVSWVIQTGAWAGGTAAVTLKQATSDGGSSAAVSFTKYYTVAGETVTENTASSNTFNLNVTSGYDWVKIAIAFPGNNTDLYSVTAIAHNLKYGPDARLLA